MDKKSVKAATDTKAEFGEHSQMHESGSLFPLDSKKLYLKETFFGLKEWISGGLAGAFFADVVGGFVVDLVFLL